jgi:superkiller protein 3
MVNLAKSYQAVGRLTDAIKLLEEALPVMKAKMPDHEFTFNCMTCLASAYGEACRTQEALTLREEMLLKYARPHIGLGNTLYDQNKLDAAMAEYRKAIELDPKSAYAHFGLGKALHGKGQLDEAIAAYRQAIRLKPNYGCAFSNLGLALLGKGLVDEAVAACKEGVRLGPAEHVDHHINLGMALAQKGLTGEAIASYGRAIEIAPKNAGVHNNLGWLLATCSEARFRHPARAVELAKKAVALMPKDGTMWNTLGAAHYRAGNWKEAVAALEKSIELRQGGDSFDWYFLAMAHWQLGERKKPRDWFDKAGEWMDQNQPKNEELRRFRAEAAELLKIEAERANYPEAKKLVAPKKK